MRVIVTEKGQDLRKELFFDKLNQQNTINIADDPSVNQGTGREKRSMRASSVDTNHQEGGINHFVSEQMMHKKKQSYQSVQSLSPQRGANHQIHPEMVEMIVHIPKIKISKYFKSKYHGAYIPPSQLKEMTNRKGGLVFS